MGIPINDWKTLDQDIAGPHSIASDGRIYVAEDTGRNRIFVYKQNNNGELQKIQIIDNVGRRPHRTLYDNDTKKFYVLSSETQEIYVFENSNNKREKQYLI